MNPLVLLKKLKNHAQLAIKDPEKFGSNLLQYFNAEEYHKRKLDLMEPGPLHLKVKAAGSNPPRINVVQPSLTPNGMTGGPNTVVNLAAHMALAGIPTRLITAHTLASFDQEWFKRHMVSLTGQDLNSMGLEVLHAGDSSRPAAIEHRDVFMATHWTTVLQIQPYLTSLANPWFFYLIQDFEPGFYAWSSNHANALSTYEQDHVGIFNEEELLQYMALHEIGRYQNSVFVEGAMHFRPALDRKTFFPPVNRPNGSARRLIFYARPTNPRNMFGIGLRALQDFARHPAIKDQEWEFMAIGDRGSIGTLELAPGKALVPAPWMDYKGYADLLRASDVLLCPMLSPHTSYPVLEMAACGGLVVTNTFATKTAASLRNVSLNIIATQPNASALAGGILNAAERLNTQGRCNSPVHLPSSWTEAFEPVVRGLKLHLANAK